MYSLIITYTNKKVKHFLRFFPKFVLDFELFQWDGLILRELRVKISLVKKFKKRKKNPVNITFTGSNSGGLEGIRTLDPHNANVVRSQLRYKPMCSIAWVL